MAALALMPQLRQHGVQLQDNGGRLKVTIPAGLSLSDELKREIRTHRREILERLRSGGVRRSRPTSPTGDCR